MALNADPYRTLGLSRGASLDDVKRAYRRLAKANHPDAAGPGALARFLAIQAAYEQLAGGGTDKASGSGSRPTPRARPSAADPDRTEAARRAYGRGRRRDDGRSGTGRPPGTAGAGGPTGAGDAAGARSASGVGGTARPAGGARPDGAAGGTKSSAARGKATLGSTSYDGADGGPFEPDWGGASWYGTTSGTYWTINPKEYADPRKHGPEYQARARRAAGVRGGTPDGGRGPAPGPSGAPTHTTSSWWESTSGPATESGEPADATADPAAATGPAAAASTRPRGTTRPAVAPAPDPASAAVELGRALTDPRSGGLRGRAVRACLGWLPIALGLGWLVGELTGCGRFAATCDPTVMPAVAVVQAIVLAGLLFLPEVAAITAGAALVLLGASLAASLILSATGTAADEGSREAALGGLLIVAWLAGLALGTARRIRSGSGSGSAGPVS